MHLVIDNYDSFTYNVVQYLGMLGVAVEVRRNDEIGLADIREMAPASVIISPGPCSPKEAGISVDVVRHFGGNLPILGICLGHQCIGEAFGAKIRRADAIFHGKTSVVSHTGEGLFLGVPKPVTVGRYHSLVVDELPPCLEIVAFEERADGGKGEIMAIRHQDHAIFGVQFHPESILTEYGMRMMANFLSIAVNGYRSPPVIHNSGTEAHNVPRLLSKKYDDHHIQSGTSVSKYHGDSAQ